jgi:hypothetical protein
MLSATRATHKVDATGHDFLLRSWSPYLTSLYRWISSRKKHEHERWNREEYKTRWEREKRSEKVKNKEQRERERKTNGWWKYQSTQHLRMFAETEKAFAVKRQSLIQRTSTCPSSFPFSFPSLVSVIRHPSFASSVIPYFPPLPVGIWKKTAGSPFLNALSTL